MGTVRIEGIENRTKIRTKEKQKSEPETPPKKQKIVNNKIVKLQPNPPIRISGIRLSHTPPFLEGVAKRSQEATPSQWFLATSIGIIPHSMNW